MSRQEATESTCRWCKETIGAGALRCTKCGTWQGSAYGPRATMLASVLQAILIPVAIGVVTLEYQAREHERDAKTQADNRQQDAARMRLEQTFSEVKSIVGMLGDWQTNYESLLVDCEPDHRDDVNKCLADYTKRLVKFDAYIAELSWAVASSPAGEFPRSRVQALGDAWWPGGTGVRDTITRRLGYMAIRASKTAKITSEAWPQKDYNALVARCEDKWNDPDCPNLLQCQEHGFEHSECVKEIGDALSTLDPLTSSAFCAVVSSLDTTRIDVFHELNASEASLAAYEHQLCHSWCYATTNQAGPEARRICGGAPSDVPSTAEAGAPDTGGVSP